MSIPLVECVPNFSEARRPEVMEAIYQTIKAVTGVHILNQQSDNDHNRSVITFVGTPQAVEEAAFQAIAKAAELIDLNEHSGEHPRIGATDVVPFIPISDITMQECVDIARRLGQRVGQELEIPVYLYEEAALVSERRNLENIRRGQFEGLKEEIEENPERFPDYGPKRLGPAGATVIGARHPLIAYNIYLTTSDISIAQHIARAVRHSSGGLRYLKALGFLVEGRAQVSMNLTNYKQTPLARVVEMVRREATRYGVGVHHSELIGLIPHDAMLDAARWYLQLDGFQKEQILETCLAKEIEGKLANGSPVEIPNFLDDLAAGTPAPGGGAAAAQTGAMAAALLAMVTRLTLGKKMYVDVHKDMWRILERAESLRAWFTEAVHRDSEAFTAVLQAFQLSKKTVEDQTVRTQAVDQATFEASQIQMEVAEASLEILGLIEEVCRLGNVNALADAATGGELAHAAFTSATYNVRANCSSMSSAADGEIHIERLRELEVNAAQVYERVQKSIKERGNFS